MANSISDPKEALRAAARAAGFDVVRFAAAAMPPDADARLREFLAAGRHGEMGWLANDPPRRADPTQLWPEARSIIMLGVNYGPETDPRNNGCGISVYAGGDDYHELIKKRLKALAREMIARFGGDAKVFVDTAPVLEKALAETAGIGWQGKHTNLVSRDFGSWLFLGSVFTTLALEPDPPEHDHCGACHACLDACPTEAFVGPYRMDARRCISYLTIENKGPIPREFREKIGTRIYGCDDCLAACPWNKFAQTSREVAFRMREAYRSMTLADFARLDDAAFRALFAKSPIKRIGRDRFVRNVLIAVGNGGGDAADAEKLLGDPSPLVRGAAVWALSQRDAERFADLRETHLPLESDDAVREEWQIASPALREILP